MDIYDIRRENMAWLIRERYKPKRGSQKRFADAIGRQPDYVSRCLKGVKRIGEKLARDIESAIGLPRGWMDIDFPDRSGPIEETMVTPAPMTVTLEVSSPADVWGKALLVLMNHRGLSRQMLAERSGVPVETITDILDGRTDQVPADVLQPLAEALEVPVYALAMPPELALVAADSAELQRLIALYRERPRQMQKAVMAFLEALEGEEGAEEQSKMDQDHG